MRKQDLVQIVADTNEQLEMPDHPLHDTPIIFGDAGFVVSTSEGHMVLATSNHLEDLLEDPFVPLSADLFGHLMFITYGAVVVANEDGDIDEDEEPVPTRLIIGISREGAVVSAMRRLDNRESIIDEDGFSVQGELREVLLGLATR